MEETSVVQQVPLSNSSGHHFRFPMLVVCDCLLRTNRWSMHSPIWKPHKLSIYRCTTTHHFASVVVMLDCGYLGDAKKGFNCLNDHLRIDDVSVRSLISITTNFPFPISLFLSVIFRFHGSLGLHLVKFQQLCH